ncbi:S41 family peptidase [uncultured Polaribacter sp.]|uniref:S41 family peptidase n=1 Tax=uncultured Polaribacter sp. TaxID=174711 RepID=UPI00261BD781|nr:S41 family peptidase [uncultured Polaribacter sp.]
MKKFVLNTIFLISAFAVFGQAIDQSFSKKKMRKDLKIFKEIRVKANSGLYKYRTKAQIDSIYNWANLAIEKSSSYRDFYNIICKLTDFEGSLHNETSLPDKILKKLQQESYGYFPYPVKWNQGNWIVNFKNDKIPLGSKVMAINSLPISEIILNLQKYYTTDGLNLSGKRIGIRKHFAKYYRLNYGQEKEFNITFIRNGSNFKENVIVEGVSYSNYYKNFNNRHSKPYDNIYYSELKESEKYNFKILNTKTGILTINTFSMGDETTVEHKKYAQFLDSIFVKIKSINLKNLVIDVRQNSGGNDPNDVLTYSYLTSRKFKESKQAWIRFKKIPFIKYIDISVPKFLRPLGVGKFNRHFQKRFPIEKDGKYFISKTASEMKIREPNKNAFKGNIYLLISPAVASAGSLFASMVSGNKKTIVIGEESMGGYFGHNGHTSLGYVLPKSGIITDFSIDNIQQDVVDRKNQLAKRGIIPNYKISQSYQGFLENKDTQMNFTLDLIKKNGD